MTTNNTNDAGLLLPIEKFIKKNAQIDHNTAKPEELSLC